MTASFIAVDIGNSTINASFVQDAERGLSVDEQPTRMDLAASDSSLVNCLSDEPLEWWAVSVNRDRANELEQWLTQRRPDDRLRLLTHQEVSMPLLVQFPDRLGMDRVAAAIGANELRRPEATAIIVDSGTAITVDVVSAAGEFLGGAIMPGVGMSAAALDRGTDALPKIVPLDTPPASVGANTEQAIRSGLYWGSFGGVKELIARHRRGREPCDLFLTGGAAVWADLLSEARLAPNLTLRGVARLVRLAKESRS